MVEKVGGNNYDAYTTFLDKSGSWIDPCLT